VRRWFTLYFIPIIPLNVAGEYIECERCKETYNHEVLHYRPDTLAQQPAAPQLQAPFARMVIDGMILMAMADGRLDDVEVRAIQSRCSQNLGMEVNEQTLRGSAARIQEIQTWLLPSLQQMAQSLDEYSRNTLVRSMVAVAMADGGVRPEEHSLLCAVVDSIGMPRQILETILTEMNYLE
jgi:uncharacterized membrane protein YebE (DUF533 family)